MKRTTIAAAITAGTILTLTPGIAYATTGAHAITCRASFTQHPESGAGWAVDTFTRTTTISPAGKGWRVHIEDVGRFTSVPGKPSDGDNSVLIENAVTGSLRGRGDYTVTGTGAPHCPAHDAYTGASGPTTGQWPLHFWAAGAVEASGIDPWHWVYATRCERMVEDSRFAKVDGNIVGKTCKPRHRPTPTPSGSPTTPAGDGTPTSSPTTVPVGAPQTGDGTGHGGPNGPLIVGGALVILVGTGVGGLLMFRRRGQHH